MKQANTGDTVRVHYTGMLDDGSVFDSSQDRGPLELTLGKGQVIPGFEAALVGMAEGDRKTITLGVDDAYGPQKAELINIVERSLIPAEVNLEVGTVLGATDPEGNQVRVVVTAFDDDHVTLDANHPLAGKALTFDLQLVEFG